MRLKHKFGAVRTDYKGFKYDSKLEARYAAKLDILKKSGKVLFYLKQVPFHLPGNTKYVTDFVEFWAPDEDGNPGDVVFTDCKGIETPMFKLKAKQVKELYGVSINVVTKA